MSKKSQAGGSRGGWYAVLCLHVSWWLFAALYKGLGVMLTTITEQFTSQIWLIGWMVAIIDGVSSIFAPLAGPLEAVFGGRTVVIVSGFMVGASMIVASFATGVVTLTLPLTLVAGPGLNFVNILSRAMMGRYFTTNYATANGFATSGHALGLIVMSPFTQLLLDTYGWRNAMLLLGGLSLNLGVCGVLLQSPSTVSQTRGNYHPIPSCAEERQNGVPDDKKSRIHAFKDAVIALKEHFGFSVGFRRSFWIAAVVFISYRFVGGLWMIYFIAQSLAKGFSAYDAVIFTSVGGVGSILGKIALGFVVDRGLLKLRPGMVVLTTVGSATFVTVPWMNSYWLMMANAFLCFGTVGSIGSLSDIYTRELLGVDLLVGAFSWMELLSGVLMFIFGFFPGWIYDQTGSFDLAFVIMGCMWILSLVALFVEWLGTRWRANQTD